MPTLHEWTATACTELQRVLADVDAAAVQALLEALLAARRIGVYGVGREGLMLRALAMRLYHLGLDAHVVGTMDMPPLAGDDCLLVSAGPGWFATVAGLMQEARQAGCTVALLTAARDTPLAKLAQVRLQLPAPTMAEAGSADTVLTMGSAYEGVQFLLGEYLVACLAARLGVSEQAMRARHTNLE